MHKPFYASGFLYHPTSGQILLQQIIHSDGKGFTLFGAKSADGREPETVFRQTVENALGVPVKAAAVHAVYDYIHHSLGEQFIFFAEISDGVRKKLQKSNTEGWVPLERISKYPMAHQTRHDITIGARVIRFLKADPTPQT